jgi:glucose/arabinose dehydrogenase
MVRRSRSRWCPLLLVGALLPPLLALPATGASAATISVSWTLRASGLVQPTAVTSARDGTGRLFVLEKGGRVKAYRNGRVTTYLDLSSRVGSAGEGGLLGIAFHPDFRRHPFLWVAYSLPDGSALRVARFRASSATAGSVRAATGRRVLDAPHPRDRSNHWAGQLAFGPDRMLYLSTGDGGDGGARAARLDDLSGKVLRVDPLRACGGQAYCVPADNPFAAQRGVRRLVWASGLRNPWRFSFDPATRNLWVADVGEGTYEEVTPLGPAAKGRDLGWNRCEGPSATGAPGTPCPVTSARYVGPRLWYGRDYGSTVIGGFVYRGAKYRSFLGGRYVGGDFGSGRVFLLSGNRPSTVGSLPGVTSFGEGATRELWAVTLSGGLYRMAARRR